MIELRSKQLHHVHPGLAAIAHQFAHLRPVTLRLGQARRKLIYDVAQAVRLLVSRDLACDPAGTLDVLLAVEDFRHRARLGAHWIPEMDGEDERVPARVVVQHHLGGRVGEDAAVPIQLAVDARRRKCRRKRAGRHDVLQVQLAAAAVEIRHLAGAHVCRPNREARLSFADEIEVDEFGERGAMFARRRVKRSKPLFIVAGPRTCESLSLRYAENETT